MSGAWNVIEKKSPGGSKYKDLWEQMAVCVPAAKHKAMLLTPKARTELGNPNHVVVMTQGTKVAIMPSSGNNTNSYSIVGKDKMARISCPVDKFMPSFPYTVVYEAWKDGEMLVFDTANAKRME